ncbi:MAG: hypothetical protein Q9182_005445 [Xanthomendoza sp. 2 TL-2023]
MSSDAAQARHTAAERERRGRHDNALEAMYAAIPGTPTRGYKADRIEHCAHWTRTVTAENRQLAAFLRSLQQQGANPQHPIVPPPRPQPAAPATPWTEQPLGSYAPSPSPPNYNYPADADMVAYRAALPSFPASMGYHQPHNNFPPPNMSAQQQQQQPPQWRPIPPQPLHYYNPPPSHNTFPITQHVPAPPPPPPPPQPRTRLPTLTHPAGITKARAGRRSNDNEPSGSRLTFEPIDTPTTMLRPMLEKGVRTEGYRELKTKGREGFKGREAEFVGRG